MINKYHQNTTMPQRLLNLDERTIGLLYFLLNTFIMLLMIPLFVSMERHSLQQIEELKQIHQLLLAFNEQK